MTTNPEIGANPEIGERIDVAGIGTNYIVAGEGDPLILLRRDGDSFECVQAGIRGSVKLELAALTASSSWPR